MWDARVATHDKSNDPTYKRSRSERTIRWVGKGSSTRTDQDTAHKYTQILNMFNRSAHSRLVLRARKPKTSEQWKHQQSSASPTSWVWSTWVPCSVVFEETSWGSHHNQTIGNIATATLSNRGARGHSATNAPSASTVLVALALAHFFILFYPENWLTALAKTRGVHSRRQPLSETQLSHLASACAPRDLRASGWHGHATVPAPKSKASFCWMLMWLAARPRLAMPALHQERMVSRVILRVALRHLLELQVAGSGATFLPPSPHRTVAQCQAPRALPNRARTPAPCLTHLMTLIVPSVRPHCYTTSLLKDDLVYSIHHLCNDQQRLENTSGKELDSHITNPRGCPLMMRLLPSEILRQWLVDTWLHCLTAPHLFPKVRNGASPPAPGLESLQSFFNKPFLAQPQQTGFFLVVFGASLYSLSALGRGCAALIPHMNVVKRHASDQHSSRDFSMHHFQVVSVSFYLFLSVAERSQCLWYLRLSPGRAFVTKKILVKRSDSVLNTVSQTPPHGDELNAHTSRTTHKSTCTPHHINTHINMHKHITRPRQHTQTSLNITITRDRNGPSTRVPRVMLITSFGSHGSRVCASFAVLLGTVLQSLFSTLLQLDVRIQGLLLGCAVISLMMYKCFFSKPSLVCMPHHDSQLLVRRLRVGRSLVRAARRIGRRRAKWHRLRPRYPRMRVRRCVYRWCMILSWWICWLAKLSCGSLRLVGRTSKQQCEDLLPDLWWGGQSEAELNKPSLAGLGELLRSVTWNPPARREDGVRDQQTQPQRHQQRKKNRRAKRKTERDNSLVGGLQRLVDRMSKPTFSGDPLVRIKQFIEAAEKDTKSPGKNKSKRALVVAVVDPVVRTLWGRLLLARISRTTGSRREKPENPVLMLSRNAKNSSRSNLKDSMQAIARARLSIWLISFHVFPRRKLVIASLLGWLLRNRLSLEVCWWPTGSVRPWSPKTRQWLHQKAGNSSRRLQKKRETSRFRRIFSPKRERHSAVQCWPWAARIPCHQRWHGQCLGTSGRDTPSMSAGCLAARKKQKKSGQHGRAA